MVLLRKEVKLQKNSMEVQNNIKKIILFGASGHGKVVKELIESIGNTITAFIDDNPKFQELLSVPVLTSEFLKDLKKENFIISIGDNSIRKKISNKLKTNFTKAIHKTAAISHSSFIEEGSVVMAGAIINANAKIGKHCIINTNAVIEHDCEIKDFVHVSPNATITGNITIGEGTHIGAGAIVIPNIKIGKWVTVGAGSVVINDIPNYAVVVGNPAKIIKYNEVD